MLIRKVASPIDPAWWHTFADEVIPIAEEMLAKRLFATWSQKGGSEGSWVSDIETEAEDKLIDLAHRFIPSATIVSEERFPHVTVNLEGFVWIIDPLDGSGEFRKEEGKNFGLTIGLMKDGIIVASLVLLLQRALYISYVIGHELLGRRISGTKWSPLTRSQAGLASMTLALSSKPAIRAKNARLEHNFKRAFGHNMSMPTVQCMASPLIDEECKGGCLMAQCKTWDAAGAAPMILACGGAIVHISGKRFSLLETDRNDLGTADDPVLFGIDWPTIDTLRRGIETGAVAT